MEAKADDVELPNIVDFVLVQRNDAFSVQMKTLVGTSNCLYAFDKNGLLVRQASRVGSIQKFVWINFLPTVLYLTGHPGDRHLYDSLRREYYWSNMAPDVYHAVESCSDCSKMGNNFCHQCKLKLLLPNCSLEFVAIDTLRSLSRSASSNRFVVIYIVSVT